MKITTLLLGSLIGLSLLLSGCDGSGHHSSDTSAPQVTEMTPADGAAVIGATAIMQVVFNEPLDPQTVEDSSMVVESEAGAMVTGLVSYDQFNNAVLFTPNAPLENNTSYTVTLAAGVADPSGNAIEQDESWSFTTTDFAPPPPPVVQ